MLSSNAEPTIVSLLQERIAASGDNLALLATAGQSPSRTWNELGVDIRRAAAALVSLGVEPGDSVVQLSENRYEWIVCDLAIQIARAVHIPIHAPLTGQQAAYQIADCAAKVVLVSDDQQAGKLGTCAEALPSGVQTFSFDRCDARIGASRVGMWADVTAAVSGSAAEKVWCESLRSVTPDSLATILYTSGTTGEPKGVMLSQRNLTSNTLATITTFGQMSDDLRLTFLPLSHIFARTCDLYTWIAVGSRLALARSRETVMEDCVTIRPTILNGVPYFFDKLRRHLCQQDRDRQPGALRDLLGGEARLCCSGGAALPNHLFDFYQQQGVPLLQGYGLTETSPVITASSLTHNKRGSAGMPIPGVDVRIADDGEILTSGPHVMLGYYKNKAATDEIIQDGWLSTGDLGRLDDEGFLFITGRKKEIIVTAGGKNVAPVMLESLLSEDPLVEQVMVIGDGRNYLTALIVPNPEPLEAEIHQRKIKLSSRQAALTNPQVLEMYQELIQRRLRSVSHYEQVRKITLLSREFSLDLGELTPKLSLRRKTILANFSAEIEAMYVG